ncbi:LacI family DNA-binding transcriptional regulator [Paenibacillus senegalensis]|uniref:LacI family DNA-binding transcriptional regulator n=1 Tax=Paenibacillus senegalensis TaxID=1465766 RepID=UPI000289667F|nr:LacI family DNA-binding transcriptional regulator [Paenibacillus senegalensis]
MVTRNDVAKHAGVSVAVVSYVINNKNNVKESTRRRVLQSIKELGYNPNLAARSLKTKRTNQFGVLFNNLGNPFETGISLGLEAKAREYGQSLIFQTFVREEEEKLKTIFMGRTDGLILLGQSFQPETVEYFDRLGIPIISITSPVEAHPSVKIVDIDWHQAMLDILKHLQQNGHRKVGFIGSRMRDHHLHYRYQQFLRAVKDTGMEFQEDWLLLADGRLETAYMEMSGKLDSSSRLPFSAIVCANDLMAIGVLSACKDKGTNVPEELSIIGCENILMASHTTPAVTTIHYPRRLIGFTAIECMMKAVDKESTKPEGATLAYHLEVRDSSGRRQGDFSGLVRKPPFLNL